MAIDPNRWTLRTQEAFSGAVENARAENHPEVTPDHLLAALVGQPEGLALPLLARAGVEPGSFANRLREHIASLPKAYGSAEPQLSRETRDAIDAADALRREMGDEYLSVEHLLLAMAERIGVSRDRLLAALREVRGSHRVTSQTPEEQYRALEQYGARREARPGHRPGRGDPPCDPGALSAYEEQPCAHR
jgi:ATP-dependent Clp protease ATP-binding subunit ClpB